MKAECEIFLCDGSNKKAKQILESVKVDDFDFVESKIKNNCLNAKIKSKNISSLLHTIDDYLSCISVAEDIVDKD